MKIINCEQRSEEWFAVRLGIPTASGFSNLITTKGEPSKSKRKYLYKLAGELVSGQAEDTYQSPSMLRGVEMEDEARQLYQIATGRKVNTVGFCMMDDINCGASPDGLLENNGGIEIKCPTIAVHVGYLLENKLPTDYFQQVQGSLAVTGCDYWDFMSYYPGIKPLIIRVERNEEFISKLRTELKLACLELDDIIKKIKD